MEFIYIFRKYSIQILFLFLFLELHGDIPGIFPENNAADGSDI